MLKSSEMYVIKILPEKVQFNRDYIQTHPPCQQKKTPKQISYKGLQLLPKLLIKFSVMICD